MQTRQATVYTIGIQGANVVRTAVCAEFNPGAGRKWTIINSGNTEAHNRETITRVRSAIESAGFVWPKGDLCVSFPDRISEQVNTGADLAIAVAILVATDQATISAEDTLVPLYGELSLSGDVRPVRGSVAAVLGFHCVVAGGDRFGDNEIIRSVSNAHPVQRLQDLIPESKLVLPAGGLLSPLVDFDFDKIPKDSPWGIDLGDVRDLDEQALNGIALAISAQKPRPLVIVAEPGLGGGKVARRLTTLLGPMSRKETFSVIRSYDLAGLTPTQVPVERPFRAPHHTVSAAGLLSEFNLARCGVLLLDDASEFSRSSMETVRDATLKSASPPQVVFLVRHEDLVSRVTRFFNNAVIVKLCKDPGKRWPTSNDFRSRWLGIEGA